MCNTPEDLDLEGIDTVAIDIETYDPNLKTKGLGAIRGDGFITGVAVATGKDTVYFPLHHSDVVKSDDEKKEFWDQINKKLLQNDKITKVFHNAMYDICWLRVATGKMLKGRLVDTMIAASVIDENRFKYSLDALSKDILGDGKYKYDLQEKTFKWSNGMQKDPMSNMHKMPAFIVKEYAKQDVNLTFRLWKIFNKELDRVLYIKPENNAKKTCRNIFELEIKLFPCLVDMKFKGVRIDVQKLEHFGKKLKYRRDNLLNIIKKHTKVSVQLWAANSIKELLHNQKIKNYEKTPKSGMPKLPKDYLKTHSNRFLRMVSKAREADKIVNTFIEGLKGYIHNGRIHADINQIRSDQGGTVTGRFSMSNPNLQQIPAKGYIGKKMREVFLPEEGYKWGSFDYSQQEPRIVVHYAVKHNLSKTEELRDKFNSDEADFHKIVATMANIPRKQAKTINLGLFYGMGKGKLQQELNLDRVQAKKLFDTYHQKVPFVKELSDNLTQFAGDKKLVFTLEDRFCRFDKYESVNKRWNNKERKFEEWDPEAKEIKNKKTGEITYQGDWITPKLMSKEVAWEKFKLQFNAKSKSKAEGGKGKIEELDSQERETWFTQYFTPAFTYKALNRLIQGSAADMTKKAMVILYEKGIVPHIQIHDELCISITDDEQKEKIKDIMEQAIKLEIPNKVNYKTGSNWGSIK
jgi:DNA polymerase I-like protein with 3'-5' exonuclease and polymerase domains